MGEQTSAITFESIFEMVRKEKTNEDIQILQQDTYSLLTDYLKTKLQAYRDAQQNKLIPTEIERIKSQITSARKLIKELYERRERKLMGLAINKSRTSGEIDLSGVLEIEKPILEEITKILNKYRRDILLNVLNAKPASVEKENYSPKEQKKMIRFLSHVPKFLGKEMEIYGPFREGDIAHLPSEIADILIKKERAEEIKPHI